MTEREQFEKWANAHFVRIPVGNDPLAKNSANGLYVGGQAQLAWLGWQAGRNSALEGLKELAQKWKAQANDFQAAHDSCDDAYSRQSLGNAEASLRQCIIELELIEGEKKTS